MSGAVVLVARIHGHIQGLFDLVGWVDGDGVGVGRKSWVAHVVIESVLLNQAGVSIILT